MVGSELVAANLLKPLKGELVGPQNIHSSAERPLTRATHWATGCKANRLTSFSDNGFSGSTGFAVSSNKSSQAVSNSGDFLWHPHESLGLQSPRDTLSEKLT